MNTNYVLVDYENVQPREIEDLVKPNTVVYVFLGAKQKVDSEYIVRVQAVGGKFIRIDGQSKNALDLHIAYYIGEHAKGDATFQIISKDAGYDPLIKHLRERKIKISRIKGGSKATVATNEQEKPATPKNQAKSEQSQIDKLVADLKKRTPETRPAKLSTLLNTTQNLFKPAMTSEQANDLVEKLVTKGYIKVEGTKVTYHLI